MNTTATPYSNIKIFAHSDRLKMIKDGIRSSPIYIRIKPTNVCNHKCNYCSYADNHLGLRDAVGEQDQIPWSRLRLIIDDMRDIGVKAVTFSGGGEPLVYPHINEAIVAVIESGIDLSLITNGQLLRDETARLLHRAKWVRISMDAADSGTYSAIRNLPASAFARVCDNITSFAATKPNTCELGINFVINHMNHKQIYDMAKLVKDLGANHIKFTARVTKDLHDYHSPFIEEAVLQIKKAEQDFTTENFIIINKYEGDFEHSTVFKRIYKKCYMKELVTVIAADSKIYFCHDKAYVQSGAVADLAVQTFKDAWFSESVRERYDRFDAELECNHHCVYDDRNILLNQYFTLDSQHINFI